VFVNNSHTYYLLVSLQTDGPVEQPEVLPEGWERCEGMYM